NSAVMIRVPHFILLALALASPGSIPSSWSARERDAAKRIDKNVIAAHVRFLSDDLLEGRSPASRGSELAMKYIAAQYERLGLTPAGHQGSWLQKFEPVGLKSSPRGAPTLRGAAGATLTLKPGVDSVLASGVQQESTALRDAELVFVGYGITAPEYQWDDF